MLFDIENENGIIVNARDCCITYSGRVWYELPTVDALPVGYHMVGRVGSFHFYMPGDFRAVDSALYYVNYAGDM